MSARFKVNEYSAGFEVEDTVTGQTHWMGDGVDVFEDLSPGEEGFVAAWEESLNANEDETLEAYFRQTYNEEAQETPLGEALDGGNETE